MNQQVKVPSSEHVAPAPLDRANATTRIRAWSWISPLLAGAILAAMPFIQPGLPIALLAGATLIATVFAAGRTTMLQGAVHFVIFAVFLFFAVVP